MKEAQNSTEQASSANSKVKTRSRNLVPAAIIALLIVGALALLLWQLFPRGSGGRPVPVPRNVGPARTEITNSGEANLTVTPEQVQRAGIKIETVGERISAEAGGQQTTGIVQPNSYRETPVMSLVGGIVRTVGPELGDTVRRGQTVAVVSSNDLADTQAKYLTAVAELEEHHKHHTRAEKLVEIGAASREDLEAAASKLKAAESEVGNLRQRLLLLGLSSQRVSGLHSTSQINSEVSFPAPSTGTVTSRAVNAGEVIGSNQELLRVTDLSSVWVVAQVYEKDLGKVHVGSAASITTDAYSGRVFRGRVSYVDPKVEAQTRTAQVRIELANPGQVLKIGMYVNVAFAALASAGTTTPIVSVNAVQNLGNRKVVFVATGESNGFVMRPVRVGPESNGYYSVFEGLSAGDRIVTEGSFMLRAEWLKTHPSQ